MHVCCQFVQLEDQVISIAFRMLVVFSVVHEVVLSCAVSRATYEQVDCCCYTEIRFRRLLTNTFSVSYSSATMSESEAYSASVPAPLQDFYACTPALYTYFLCYCCLCFCLVSCDCRRRMVSFWHSTIS